MKLPFLSQDQIDQLSILRTNQADLEVDLMVDASIQLGLEEEDVKVLLDLDLALNKVEGIVLITSENGKKVLEAAGLGEKDIRICKRPVVNDMIVVAAFVESELDEYSFFKKTLVPLRVFNFEPLKKELGLVPKTKAFGKM